MNTKILVALVIGIALFGLTGAASACQTTNSDLYYQFVHTVQGQGIEIIDGLDDINSCAGFTIEGPCDGGLSENAMITNTLVNVDATFIDNRGDDGIYDATVTQTGTASILKRPLDSEDELDELEVFVLKTQDLLVSGQFTEISAEFTDAASVGVNYYDPLREIVACGNCHADEISSASGSVTALNEVAKISEAAIGTASWTSLSADGWNNIVDMDGGSSAYSSFFGDTIVPIDSPGIQTTSTATTTHTWTHDCGASPCP